MFGRGPNSMSVQEAYERSARGEGALIDVRTPAEFVSARPVGARNIPLDKLESRVNELKKDEALYLICRSGSRSGVAASFLAQSGFTNVTNVAGGLLAWSAAGLPTEP